MKSRSERYLAIPQASLIAYERLATDQKVVAERKWQAGLKPGKPQQPMDDGLFGDAHKQIDLFAK